MHKVFVYGTLKSGGGLRGLDTISPESMIVGRAKTTYPDFEMLDLGAFPGVIDGEKYIQGEVWEVDENTFDVLDRIEGYPTFYNRKLIPTTQGKAWMYYLKDHENYSDCAKSTESDSIETVSETLIWSNR